MYFLGNGGLVSTLTRSQLLARGGLAVATAGGLSALFAPAAGAGVEEDLASVRLCSAAEVVGISFYTQGLDSDLFKGVERKSLKRALFNEGEHLAALNQTLSKAGDTATAAGYGDLEISFPDGTFTKRETFAEVGVLLENLHVGAYLGAVEAMGSADIRAALSRIAVCEGEHLSAVSSLAGFSPVGNSFPAPLDIEQASEALSPFLS